VSVGPIPWRMHTRLRVAQVSGIVTPRKLRVPPFWTGSREYDCNLTKKSWFLGHNNIKNHLLPF
jgi:hypothetical protein